MKKSVVPAITLLILASGAAPAATQGPLNEEESIEQIATAPPPAKEQQLQPAKVALTQPAPVLQAWENYPNTCESFRVVEGTKRVKNKRGELVYPVVHRRNRFKRSRKDQKRTAALVRMVVREMGGNVPAWYLTAMMAHHEASFNSEAIHILNPDLEANRDSRLKHHYDARREADLERKLKASSAQSKEFWDYKATLGNLRLYKGNIYWNDKIQYTYTIPERERGDEKFLESSWEESRSVWVFAYAPEQP